MDNEGYVAPGNEEGIKQPLAEKSENSNKSQIVRVIICFIFPVASLIAYAIVIHSIFSAVYVLTMGILIVLTFERHFEDVKALPNQDDKLDGLLLDD